MPPTEKSSENLGWIKLHRKILDSRVFQNEGLFKVWVWCLLRANHAETWVPIKVGRGTTEIHLLPGQFIFGRHAAAKQLRMNPETVRKRMQKLKNSQNITIKSTSHYSIITIINWGSYQSEENKSTMPSTNQVPTKYQPSTTDKNDKNEKNEKTHTQSERDSFFSVETSHSGNGDTLEIIDLDAVDSEPEYPGSEITEQETRDRIFVSLYQEYPKPGNEVDARNEFEQVASELIDFLNERQLMPVELIEKHKASAKWQAKNGRYIPYLNQYFHKKQWDELTAASTNRPISIYKKFQIPESEKEYDYSIPTGNPVIDARRKQ